MRVKFHTEYDHEFQSRAVLNFPAGYEGTVTREVGNAAVAKGRAVELTEAGGAPVKRRPGRA